MTDEQIHKLFQLMAGTTNVKRANIRSLYLDGVGEKIVPFCVEYFQQSDDASFRSDLVQFVIRYGRSSQTARKLAAQALQDPSHKVRRMACAVMAYSLDTALLPLLEAALDSEDEETMGNAQRAMDAITKQDIHLFVKPTYDQWDVSQDRKGPPARDDVDRYIKKYAPDLVEPLTEILGDIYLDGGA